MKPRKPTDLKSNVLNYKTVRGVSEHTMALRLVAGYRCPKCGRQTDFNVDPDRLSGAIGVDLPKAPELSGAYCLRCFIEWWTLFVPKLEPVTTPEDEHRDARSDSGS